jgi:hypothetical protein
MNVTENFKVEIEAFGDRLYVVSGLASFDEGQENGDYFQPPASWKDLLSYEIRKIEIFSDKVGELPCTSYQKKLVKKLFDSEIISEIERQQE